ncbi:hypothetical protein NDU88_004758 [Pleurodeles waltl]|uniref:Uncharacterized protein n=1 Tax=Pleurodeles waltl TaxID=8319 RepID=A0AAV7UGM6_PLEWA|nr:hypothetical protein NDU88_004758 [Pleurodeles waltl]
MRRVQHGERRAGWQRLSWPVLRHVSLKELEVSVRRRGKGRGEMGLGGGRGIPTRRVRKATGIVLRVGPRAKGNDSGLASRRAWERRGGGGEHCAGQASGQKWKARAFQQHADGEGG